MIRKINDGVIINSCNNCGTEFGTRIPEHELKYVPELDCYDNVRTDPCPTCGIVEAFIVDKVPDELESYEFVEEKRVSNRDLNHLKYVRDLKTMVNFQDKTNTH